MVTAAAPSHPFATGNATRREAPSPWALVIASALLLGPSCTLIADVDRERILEPVPPAAEDGGVPPSGDAGPAPSGPAGDASLSPDSGATAPQNPVGDSGALAPPDAAADAGAPADAGTDAEGTS